MKKNTKWLPIVLIVIMVVAISSIAIATDNHLGIYYDKTRLTTYIPHGSIGTQTKMDMNDALYQWNYNSGYMLMRREPSITHITNDYPKPEGQNKVYKLYLGNSFAPGENTMRFEVRVTGNTYYYVVVESDIVFNASRPFTNTPMPHYYDVWTIFIHEAGHTLGLAHPSNSSSVNSSVMHVLSAGNSRRFLSNSDKAMMLTRLK